MSSRRQLLVAVGIAGAWWAAATVPGGAEGPLQLTPQRRAPAAHHVPKPTTRPSMQQPVAAAKAPLPKEPEPKPAQPTAAPAPAAAAHQPDLAYGAYQRGYYLTAFSLATRRAQEKGDRAAMTLLGELYANGFGVNQDDKKAVEWYKLAADRGDRDAMFALAMLHLAGRAGPPNREEAAKLLAAAAKLGHPAASYDLGLFYLEGKLFPTDFARAAELFRAAAEAGNPEAQYALATLYKDGKGVPKDLAEAARLLAAAALADNTDAQVEYGIALFNGTGVARNEAAAAAVLTKAAHKGSAIAQDRLARIYSAGRGLPADPVKAVKWHLVSVAGGATDIELDDFMRRQTPDVRAAGEKAAKPWIDAIKAARESKS